MASRETRIVDGKADVLHHPSFHGYTILRPLHRGRGGRTMQNKANFRARCAGAGAVTCKTKPI